MGKKCLIIGGGFAGLTSAVYLTKAGFKVTLLESSNKLGGRAYSLKDKKYGTVIDNGQHILMGCYKYTLDFINEIGAGDKIIKQDRLSINFLKENLKLLPLSAADLPYPVNLLFALIGYKAFTIEDKLRLAAFFTKLPLYSKKDLERMSVEDWLLKENQSENAINSFWDILIVGALNTNKKKASAKIFADILMEIFFKGNNAATILIPQIGLSETYCNNAEEFIRSAGGEIYFGKTVKELKSSGTNIKKVITSGETFNDFDFVISSIPLYAFNRIKKDKILELKLELKYSSILTVHIWLKENLLTEPFYGLIGSPIHWIFNHGEHITLVISDADRFMDEEKKIIFDLAAEEILKYTFIKRENILAHKIIKEKRATFIPSKSIINKRPSNETPFENFLLAGDWTDTGLPSTIESAVKSGRTTADIIISKEKA